MEYKDVHKLTRLHRNTIYKYVKQGKIRTTKINDKHLIYNDDDVYAIAGISLIRDIVIYARVSTSKQKKDLENQIEILKLFANSNGFVVNKIYKDIASGMSFDRQNFKDMLFDVIEHKIKTVLISNKDRFSRVSFNMWKELFKSFNCDIIVMNDILENNENDDKEIFEDIISLIHCFAMKMYSKRRKNKLKLIEENLEVDI